MEAELEPEAQDHPWIPGRRADRAPSDPRRRRGCAWPGDFPKHRNSAIEKSTAFFELSSKGRGATLSLLVSLGSGEANDLHLEIIALEEAALSKAP